MTNRIPPRAIGTEMKTFYSNTNNLNSSAKRKLDIFTSHDADQKVTDPFEQLQLNVLQNGDKAKINFKEQNIDNIKWDGNKGTIKIDNSKKNHIAWIWYTYTKNNDKVKLEKCEAFYATKETIGGRDVLIENSYTDKDGNLSVDEKISTLSNCNGAKGLSTSYTIIDENFDAIPDRKIIYSENEPKTQIFDEKVGTFKDLK